jgi:hypothetical protein
VWRRRLADCNFGDFEDLKKVTGLISNKAHFTPEGMDQIIKIKSQMNKGRKELI